MVQLISGYSIFIKNNVIHSRPRLHKAAKLKINTSCYIIC